MTETSKSHPRGPRRRSLLLTLLLATAALAGAQALVPGLASATIQMGEECADPTYPSADCEPNGGGGGSQGGGTSDGSIAGEVIEVHDTPPSPCVVNPSSCLPRETGNRLRGVQADRGPYQPHRGGRPARVAERPKPIWLQRCASQIRSAKAAAKALDAFEQSHLETMARFSRLGELGELVRERRSERESLQWIKANPSIYSSADIASREAAIKSLEEHVAEWVRELDDAYGGNLFSRANAVEKADLAAYEAMAACHFRYEPPNYSRTNDLDR